ncbi:MAG: flagellar basal body-associated FliL family protein, partial [Pseudomonadota bacterium]
ASAPPPPVNLEVACKEIKPAEKLSVEELEARGAKYVTLEPITVSLAPNAGAKNLKIGISLSTPPDASELTDIQFLRLRDRFLERLRTVDTNLLIDPKAMPVLKQALLAQAQATLGTDAVYSVLITDFLMK